MRNAEALHNKTLWLRLSPNNFIIPKIDKIKPSIFTILGLSTLDIILQNYLAISFYHIFFIISIKRNNIKKRTRKNSEFSYLMITSII